MTEERREFGAVDGLGGPGPGLGELPCDSADLDRRNPGGVHQDDGHLQDDPQLLPDGDGVESVERLGAITGLEQKRLAFGHPAEVAHEFTSLAGEDKGRHGGKLLLHPLQFGRIGPSRLLGRRLLPPRFGCPSHGLKSRCAR